MSQSANNNDEDSPLKLEAKFVARKFGFEPSSAKLLSASARCFKVRATTDDGRTNDLFLKWTEDIPRSEIWMQEALLANGFISLPQMYKTVDSQPLFELSGKYWTCQPFLVSEFEYDWLDFDCNSQHCFQAGQTLALIHTTGSKILRGQERVPSPRIVSATMQRFIDRFERTSHRLANLKAPANVENESSSTDAPLFSSERIAELNLEPALEVITALPFDRLRKRARQIADQLISIEKTAQQTINHGDYHPGNILFTSSGLEAVCDWEYACIGSAIYDLSCAMFMFCFQAPLGAKSDADCFSARRTEAFLDGYMGTASVHKNMSKLNAYMEYIHLMILEWACSEILKADSHYIKNPQFPKFLLALSIICQF